MLDDYTRGGKAKSLVLRAECCLLSAECWLLQAKGVGCY